jgi:endonuclease/exonuclease/phosphatase family metal-dependent hydrolase
MARDEDFLSECLALRRAVTAYPTLDALHAAPEGPALWQRVMRMLGTVRRYAPGRDPGPPADAARVHAVHWNIEHGNWYDQVEGALLEHPDLAGADLLLFNEIDLGMARAANRDVTADLNRALDRHAIWAPLFLETTLGRDDDELMAAGRDNQESLFGLAILSRWPIGAVRIVELPSPAAIQFSLERMLGRHIGLIATIERPGAPFVAVAVHLEVHRTRAHRATQMRVLLEALRVERQPVVLAGDFNSHTFDRGLWHAPLAGAAALFGTPGPALRRRLLRADRGRLRETLFDELRASGFAWEPYVDYAPTLQLRYDRIDEARAFGFLHRAAAPAVAWAIGRGQLRLDWFAGRGWKGGRGKTVSGLDGPGKASDHAPLVAEFR